jgi:hypothetical protein
LFASLTTKLNAPSSGSNKKEEEEKEEKIPNAKVSSASGQNQHLYSFFVKPKHVEMNLCNQHQKNRRKELCFTVQATLRAYIALLRSRVARFFLVQTYQNEKYIPKDHKLYQSAINYT